MYPAGKSQDASKRNAQAATLTAPPQHYSSSLTVNGDLASSTQAYSVDDTLNYDFPGLLDASTSSSEGYSNEDGSVEDDPVLWQMDSAAFNAFIYGDSCNLANQLPTEGALTLQGRAVTNDFYDPDSDLGIKDSTENELLEEASAEAGLRPENRANNDLIEAREVDEVFSELNNPSAATCSLDNTCDSMAFLVNNQPCQFPNSFGSNSGSGLAACVGNYSHYVHNAVIANQNYYTAPSFGAGAYGCYPAHGYGNACPQPTSTGCFWPAATNLDPIPPSDSQSLMHFGLSSNPNCVSWIPAFNQGHNAPASLLPGSHNMVQPENGPFATTGRKRKEKDVSLTQVTENKNPYVAVTLDPEKDLSSDGYPEDVLLTQVTENKNPYVAVTLAPEKDLPPGMYPRNILSYSTDQLALVIAKIERSRGKAEEQLRKAKGRLRDAEKAGQDLKEHRLTRCREAMKVADQVRRLELFESLLSLRQKIELQKRLIESLRPQASRYGVNVDAESSLGTASTYNLESGLLGDEERTRRQFDRDRRIVGSQYITFKTNEVDGKIKSLIWLDTRVKSTCKGLSQKSCSPEENAMLYEFFRELFQASVSGNEERLSEIYDRLQTMIGGLPASSQGLGRVYGGPTFFSSFNQQVTVPVLPSVSSSPLTSFSPTQKFSKN